MSNKSRLETNNTNLQFVLTTVQGLPKVDDVKHGLYVWKKCSVQKELAETTKSNVYISTGASGGASYTYIYADSYSVDLDTGIFTLNNPQTYAGQVMYPPSVLNGKYIIAMDAGIGSTYTPKTSGKELWFIPSDATLTGGTGYGSADTVTSYKVNTLKSVLDFAVSDDPTAYPDGGTQGGYWYEKFQLDPTLFGCTKYAVDKFTLTERTSQTYSVPYSLDEIPKLAIIATEEVPTVNQVLVRSVGLSNGVVVSGLSCACLVFTNSSDSTGQGAARGTITINGTTIRINTSDATIYYGAGIEYTLITMA